MNTDKDELRIKVAELCGWKKGKPIEYFTIPAPQKKRYKINWISPDGYEDQTVPDYCNDLNACQELWNVIRDKGLWDEYCTWLEITVRANKGTACHKIFFYCADADEHCVTFVKTMEGK